MELTGRETHELIASAVAIHHARLETAAGTDNDLRLTDASAYNPNMLNSGDEIVVVLDPGSDEQQAYSVTVDVDQSLEVSITPWRPTGKAEKAEKVIISQLDWVCETSLATVTISEAAPSRRASRGKGGKELDLVKEVERIVQYDGRGSGQGYRLRLNGSQRNVLIRSPREHELAQHMLPRENVDVTKFLLCPMPGTLISCAVREGQEVESGQELAVVEAMKMQNVLRAERRGVVKKVMSHVGSHLKVDQVIIEFEPPAAAAMSASN